MLNYGSAYKRIPATCMINRLAQQTILDFQQGDRKAFDQVFRSYYALIVMFANKIIDSQGEAEDIAIEVFLSLFRRYNQFENEPNIRAFLYVSARNRCLNYLKAKRRHGIKNQEFIERIQDDTLLEYEYSIKVEIIEAIHAAIENLPEECRKIFKLLYYEEMKPAEIADRLQISVNTVYVQKSRAIGILRIKLRETPLALAWFLQAMALLESSTHFIYG
jgi:RNA polymerase sigma-70 factor (ECF subfamily)